MAFFSSPLKCADCVNSKVIRTVVVGTRADNSQFREAQAPSRDIFVYRVENEASESEIESHVKDNRTALSPEV